MKYLKSYLKLNERKDFKLNNDINLLNSKFIDSLSNKLNKQPIEKYSHKSGKYIFEIDGFETPLLLIISTNNGHPGGFGRIESGGITYPTIFIKMDNVTSYNILKYFNDNSNILKH